MPKNRTKNTAKRAGKQPSGKREGHGTINRALNQLNCDIAHLAKTAVDWWKLQHGRRIKAGAIKEVIHAFRRKVFRPPAWLTDYVQKNVQFA